MFQKTTGRNQHSVMLGKLLPSFEKVSCRCLMPDMPPKSVHAEWVDYIYHHIYLSTWIYIYSIYILLCSRFSYWKTGQFQLAMFATSNNCFGKSAIAVLPWSTGVPSPRHSSYHYNKLPNMSSSSSSSKESIFCAGKPIKRSWKGKKWVETYKLQSELYNLHAMSIEGAVRGSQEGWQ